jgi:hypothetical protein
MFVDRSELVAGGGNASFIGVKYHLFGQFLFSGGMFRAYIGFAVVLFSHMCFIISILISIGYNIKENPC